MPVLTKDYCVNGRDTIGFKLRDLPTMASLYQLSYRKYLIY